MVKKSILLACGILLLWFGIVVGASLHAAKGRDSLQHSLDGNIYPSVYITSNASDIEDDPNWVSFHNYGNGGIAVFSSDGFVSIIDHNDLIKALRDL